MLAFRVLRAGPCPQNGIVASLRRYYPDQVMRVPVRLQFLRLQQEGLSACAPLAMFDYGTNVTPDFAACQGGFFAEICGGRQRGGMIDSVFSALYNVEKCGGFSQKISKPALKPQKETRKRPAMAEELYVFGTGNASALNCYNTCFAIRSGDEYLMCDAGGGNGILSILQEMDVPLAAVHHLVVTHEHTDHVLGVVWLVRMIATAMLRGKYQGNLHIYGHEELLGKVRALCTLTL